MQSGEGHAVGGGAIAGVGNAEAGVYFFDAQRLVHGDLVATSGAGTVRDADEDKPLKVVKTFTCPVDGCQQRVNTAPKKPSSAIEIYA